MRKRAFVIGAAAGLMALLAVACGDGATTIVQSSGPVSGISVSGRGQAVGDADLAILQLGVDVERDSVAEARSVAAEAMEVVLASLRANGVADSDLQTVQFSIQPQFDFSERTQTLRGFRVSNVVTAKIRDLDTTGAIIDDATSAGGDNVVVRNISFTIEDVAELREQARQAAVEEARQKAEQLAANAGVSLGQPLSIVEGFAPTVPQPFETRSLVADEAATPILAGELEVVVTVQIVYTIE